MFRERNYIQITHIFEISSVGANSANKMAIDLYTWQIITVMYSELKNTELHRTCHMLLINLGAQIILANELEKHKLLFLNMKRWN